MEQHAQITSLAEKLSWEVRELSLGTIGEIERIQGAPNPLRFLRDFVLPNKPCIISHAIDHWPALAAWSNAYLRAALTDQQVSVHFTPDGFADALVDLDRISSVFGCIIEPPPPCDPLGTEPPVHSPQSSPHKPQLHHDVGAFANACADGREDDALNFGENSPVQPPASSPQMNGDVGANQLADAAQIDFMNCDVGAIPNVSAEGAHIDDRGDAAFKLKNDNAAQSGAVSRGKLLLEMGIPCNQPSSEHQLNCTARASGYDTCDYVEQASSKDSKAEGPIDIFLEMNSLPKTPHNSSCSIKSREERIQQAWFVTAHVEHVPFSTALDLILHSEIGSGVAYAQEQNSCFLSEYSVLATDAETHLPWATEAFGCLPEALLQEKNILLYCHLQTFTVCVYESIHLPIM